MGHYRAGVLAMPCYEDLDELTRSVHFSDLKECYDTEELIPSDLKSRVVDTSDVGEVLWFGPSLDSSEHNRYGNVSFSLPMGKVVRRFGKKLYYIDKLEFQTHTSIRLLLTRDSYRHLKKVNLDIDGSPVTHKRWEHVVADYGSTHIVNIAIEVEGDDCSWLYEKCDVEANDHSSANTKEFDGRYDKDFCFLYNTAKKQHCPYAYGRSKARKYLKKNFPDL